MYCDRCGAEIAGEPRFCPSCGKALGTTAMPLMPEASRITGHLRLMGILWLAISAFRLVPAIAIVLIFSVRSGVLPPDAPPFLPVLMQVLGRLLLLAAGLGFVAGWGLLTKQTWARTFAIICGSIGLIDMPFGTALGIYTMWVLLPQKSEAEYQRLSRAGLGQIEPVR